MKTNITGGIALALTLAAASLAGAQSITIKTDDDWCKRDERHSDHDRYCEVREVALDGNRDVIKVDAEPNGGIKVRGWDKSNILVRAKVVASAESNNAAQVLARKVKLETGDTIKANGPRSTRNAWFSVSYEIFAPEKSNVELESNNGGIVISDIDGRSRFETVNGGIQLTSLSGDVSGKTTNGGIKIKLEGDHWNGRGLNVETVNGGVSIVVPENYSADLETGTVNGRAKIDFPVQLQGRFDQHLSTKLGDGGRRIRAVTTNGGVVVKRG